MIIDTLMKGVLRRYNDLIAERNADYAMIVRDGGKDSEFETNMEWVNDIIENTDMESQDNNLDLAAALLIKEELLIKNDR